MDDRTHPAVRAALAAIGLALALAGPGPARAGTPALAPGHYAQVDPSTGRPLKVGNAITLRPAGSGALAFDLSAIRALDDNSGNISGTVAPGLPASWQVTSPAKCRLTFAAAPHGFTIAQDSNFGDCGFGYGVFADGTYARIPSP